GRKFVLAPSMALGVVAALGLGIFGGTFALIGFLLVLGVANGYSRPGPTAIIADVADPEVRAVAVAGYRIAGDLGALIGPVVAGTQVRAVTKIAGIALTDVMTVTVWEPMRRLEIFHERWPIRGRAWFSLAPDGSGTAFEWVEDLVPPLGPLGELGGRVLRAPI